MLYHVGILFAHSLDARPHWSKRLMEAQRTLRRPISCVGIGLHSGCKVNLSLKPADLDHGIRFRRTDMGNFEVPATVNNLAGIQLATAGYWKADMPV